VLLTAAVFLYLNDIEVLKSVAVVHSWKNEPRKISEEIHRGHTYKVSKIRMQEIYSIRKDDRCFTESNGDS